MLATPHIIGGGAVGKIARRPWIAFPLALGLHFVLDAVPHIDTHGLFGSPNGLTRPEVIWAAVDSLLGIALVILLVGRRPGWKVMYGAALFGILPDFAHVPPVSGWFDNTPSMHWFGSFHHWVQHNVPPSHWLLGLSTQIVFLAIAIRIIRAPSKASAKRRNV